MKKLLSICGIAVATLMPLRVSRAQLAAPNETGVTMGHVHLVLEDVEAGKTFWLAMGATPSKVGANEVMKFPGVLILLRKGEPSGGSVGSVVNHIGFYVPNVQESVTKWKAAGLKTEPGQRAGQAYVTTPDDLVRSEVIENKMLTVPIEIDRL